MSIEFWEQNRDGQTVSSRAERFDKGTPPDPLRIPFRLMFHGVPFPADLPEDGECELDLGRLREKILEAIEFEKDQGLDQVRFHRHFVDFILN